MTEAFCERYKKFMEEYKEERYMPGYGETYVEVDASAVNGGIMTMAASGPDMPDEGWESNTWTIFWRYDETSGGITGMSWYLNRENNLIGAIWYDTTTAESEGYQQTDSDFNRWLMRIL